MPSQSATPHFSARGLFCYGAGTGKQHAYFHSESLIVCVFLLCTSLPTGAQVHNGKLVPLPVLVVGNCYEMMVSLPLLTALRVLSLFRSHFPQSWKQTHPRTAEVRAPSHKL